MRIYTSILILILMLMLIQPSEIFACSGGNELEKSLFDSIYSVVVRGTIMENSGENSILHVERYLRGQGPESILIKTTTIGEWQARDVRRYDLGCGGSGGRIASVGTHGYFLLGVSLSGAYVDISYDAMSVLPIETGNTGLFVEYLHDTYIDEETGQRQYEFVQVTPSEFETMFADFVGHSSDHPSSEPRKSRMRPLYITTQNGSTYILPINNNAVMQVDTNSEPRPCEPNCPFTSPDGSHYIHPIPVGENTYAIWYRDMTGIYEPDDWYNGWEQGSQIFLPPQITATDMLFSPNGDYLLTWNATKLTLHHFGIPLTNYEFGVQLEELWQYDLSTSSTFTADQISGYGAWNKNNNAITFWDADGLKWIDLTTMSEPQIIAELPETSSQFVSIQVDDMLPPVLELSKTGRYVRYGTEQEWKLLDNMTEYVFDDTLVTPSESQLVQVSPEEIIETTLGTDDYVCSENDAGRTICSPAFTPIPFGVHRKRYRFKDDFELRETHWLDNETLLLLGCKINKNDCYLQTLGLSDEEFWQRNDEVRYTNDFAYDDYYRQFAWAIEDYSISLSQYTYYDIDLSDQLDSPIVSLEWGEPLWYVSP